MKFKLFNFLVFLMFFSGLAAQDPTIKRVGNNNKLLAYSVIGNPVKFIENVKSNSEKIAPGLSKTIDNNIAMIKPILDKSTSIVGAVFLKENFNDEPTPLVMVKVSDKEVLNNVFINSMEDKEIIDDVLILCKDKEVINTFKKELLEEFKKYSSNQDLVAFIDLKSFIDGSKPEWEKEIPSFKPILDQIDFFTLSINFEENGIALENNLFPTKGSNLSNAFDQSNAKASDIFSYLGHGNYIMTYNKAIDNQKSIPFVIELTKAISAIKGFPQGAETPMKKLVENYESFVKVNKTTVSASCLNVDKTMIQNAIYQVDKPEEIISQMKIAKDSIQEIINGIDDPFLKNFTEMISLEIKDEGEIDGIKIYSMEVYSEKFKNQAAAMGPGLLNSMASSFYYGAHGKDFVLSSSKDELSKIFKQLKSGAPSQTIKLFSEEHWQNSKNTYVDFDLKGYAKLIKIMLEAQGMGGMIPIDGLINATYKPIAIGINYNKNLEMSTFIEYNTISVVAKEVQNIYMSMIGSMGGGQGVQPPMEQP